MKRVSYRDAYIHCALVIGYANKDRGRFWKSSFNLNPKFITKRKKSLAYTGFIWPCFENRILFVLLSQN